MSVAHPTVRLPGEPPPHPGMAKALAKLSPEQLVEFHYRVGRMHHDDGLPLADAERHAYQLARQVPRE